MGTLPASVRLALWATAAWNGAAPAAAVIERAFPDIDDMSGDLDRLELWPQIGERVLLCALPHPGHAHVMPKSSPSLMADALDAGECVFVPMFGGALVPELIPYGPQGDRGWQAHLRAYDCAPVPTHRIEMLTSSDIERTLTTEIRSTTTELDDIDAVPWQHSGERAQASTRTSAPFGLPSGMDGRLARVIWTAATISDAAEAALEQDAAGAAAAHELRQSALRRLLVTADQALADATNLAALQLAGLVPTR
ncbi:hypothetical protein IEE94_12430 [Yimella sp. cx-573]|nr:hypothetical protein [Yimella sp. cx-573]